MTRKKKGSFSKAEQLGKGGNQKSGQMIDFLAPVAAQARAKAKDALMEEVTLQGISLGSEATTGEQVVSLDVASIDPNPFQPRMTFDLAPIVDSLRTQGQLYPVLVRKMPDGRYQVADGETRLRAFKQIHQTANYPKNLEKIQAIVRDLSDEAMAITAFRSAYERKDLDGLEEAQGFSNLRNVFGWSVRALAENLGKTYSYVQARIALLAVSDEIKNVLKAGHIGPSVAVTLHKAQSEMDANSFHALLRTVADQEFNSAQIKTLVDRSVEASEALKKIEAVTENKRMAPEEKKERINALIPVAQQSPLFQTSLPGPDSPLAKAMAFVETKDVTPAAEPAVYRNNPLRVSAPAQKDPVLEIQKELFSIWPELDVKNKKKLLAFAIELRAEQSKSLSVKVVD